MAELNELNGISPVEEIRITRVREEYGWLSCMSPHPIEYRDERYRTCEALFQSLRFQDHPAIQAEIRECRSPMGAKMIARRERARLERGAMWDQADEDIDLMRQCLRLKFKQHPELQTQLIETGDAEIIEDCTTHDRESARFWGAVRVNDEWVGENRLGRLLMDFREELQNLDEANS